MEANLKAEFDELMKNENVTGYIATNDNGLCLMASPNVNEELSGVWYSIARLASQIESGGEDPLINFQGETKQCLIKKEDSVTTTVFMNR
ncbi:Hypothetical protein NTJ_11375 [Nesidiocoris tenuis]|uniref:Late endosomal/lysosomal adaptor and MAPK and MTOR activator 5 n=1 Tax=Nesidiocoris tenuis TaxID=355587 RepID=A0ABN7B2B5_9HEMI|nr:Hypothetical protein NTJ_11375 [Nesidiocoris tenuis]